MLKKMKCCLFELILGVFLLVGFSTVPAYADWKDSIINKITSLAIDRVTGILKNDQGSTVEQKKKFDIAVSFYHERNYEEAIKKFNEALDLTEKESIRSVIYSMLASCYKELNDFDKASENYGFAINRLCFDLYNNGDNERQWIKSNLFLEYFLRGEFYSDSGKYREAVSDFIHALDQVEDEPEKVEAGTFIRWSRYLLSKLHYELGCAYVKLNEHPKAREAFEKALVLEDDWLSVSVNRQLVEVALQAESTAKEL